MNRYAVSLIAVSELICMMGCNIKSDSKQERLFTEITFPEVENPVNVRSFETRKLSECFKEYKTYEKPDEFPFYPGILKGEIIYGKTWDVNDEEKGLKQFEELCQTYHLQYKANCASKIARVLSTLKAGL